MIILPDKNIVRNKFFIPIPDAQWKEPSQAQLRDQFGNVNKTYFIVKALLNDGYVAWRGRFDDRYDYDAFIYAIVTGKLQYQRSLWDLPTPVWRPDIGDQLTYEFATVRLITTPTGSLQSFTVPSDWNPLSNTVHVIGSGGSGGNGRGTGTRRATGGGGGGYSRVSNLNISGTVSFQIGNQAAGSTRTSSGFNGGTAGASTWFNGSTQAGSSVSANGGGAGNANSTLGATLAGGTGATTTGATGSVVFGGGAGGSKTGTANIAFGGGGGGAGGFNGAGLAGVSQSTDGATAGGAGGNGSGGAAGAAYGGNGGSGSDITTAVDGLATGSGGGGGGQRSSDTAGDWNGGAAGSYGAGSGGIVSYTTGTAIAQPGGQGAIIIVYQGKSVFGNMPMGGF